MTQGILTLDGYADLPPGKIAAVVTYLEMTAPPASRAGPEGQEFRLEKAGRVRPEEYRELFRGIGEDWLWFSRLLLTDSQLEAILASPHADLYFLLHDGLRKGILELDRTRFPDIELAFLGVTRDLIGRGAGRFLMAQAIDLAAWSYRPMRFWLHTCSLDHPKALAFYLKSGFTPYKRGIEVADDPRLTGKLPRTAAPDIPIIGG